MNILCLTGWQQETDALFKIAPDALHFDYGAYKRPAGAKCFKALPATPDLAIGWSLGGQLLVRAIAGGYIKPGKLLLLGAPFQSVADAHFPEGMSEADFRAIKNSYRKNPQAMLVQFQSLVGVGVIPKLWEHGFFWLEELGNSGCHSLDFSGIS